MNRTYFLRIVLGICFATLFSQLVSADCTLDQLSPALQDFIRNEQSWEANEIASWSTSAKIVHWDSPYAPHQKKVFSIQGCWLDLAKFKSLGEVQVFESKHSTISQQFRRSSASGSDEVLFFVHPASESIYEQAGLDLTSPHCSYYCATATSSNRTLLVWLPHSDFHPVMIKTSVDVEMGGRVKTVDNREAELSFRGSDLLEEIQQKDHEFKRFSIFKEPFSIAFKPSQPKGHPFSSQGSGMIVREIPNALLNGDVRLAPVLALYGDTVDGPKGKLPFFLQFFGDRKLNEFRAQVNESFITPFVREWFDLAVNYGILLEPHGQNLLVQLDSKTGMPTRKFWHRDLYGFWFHQDFLMTHGLNDRVQIPPINYDEIYWSLYGLFDGFVLHELELATQRWVFHGLLAPSSEPNPDSTYEALFRNAIIAELKRISGFDFVDLRGFQILFRGGNREGISLWFMHLSRAIEELQKMKILDWKAKSFCSESFEYEDDADLARLFAYGFRPPESHSDDLLQSLNSCERIVFQTRKMILETYAEAILESGP